MWIDNIVLILLGLISGAATAAGYFALISSIGIIPRMAGKSSTAIHVMAYENALILGGTFGTVISLIECLRFPVGSWLLIVYGILAGSFVGCLAAALAEVLQVWPVLFRRMGLKKGLNMGMLFFAMGKMAGALYFFTVIYRKG